MKKLNYAFLILSGYLIQMGLAQQPLGVTKNAGKNPDNSWYVKSTGGYDGSTGGSIFIENYPYVGLDKNSSYWVAGYIKMHKKASYYEDRIYNSNQVVPGCTKTFNFNYHNPKDGDENLAAWYSSFFQLYYSDIGCFARTSKHYFEFSRRFYNDTQVIARGPEIDDSTLSDNYFVKFIMAFVKEGSSIGDPRFPLKYSNGMYIYYKIFNADTIEIINQIPNPGASICYNPDGNPPNNSTYRVFLGSDSHGNLQDYEPSVKKFKEKVLEGESECWMSPAEMDPLLGDIYRMIFVQGILDLSDINGFYENPLTYSSTEGEIKLDFPTNVNQEGYSLMVPSSHWFDYGPNKEHGTITAKAFDNVPNTSSKRHGLRIESALSNPIDYVFRYDLTERHEDKDREFKTVAFYLGNDETPNANPIFHFYAWVLVENRIRSDNALIFNKINKGLPQRYIYIQASPWIIQNEWVDPYLKIHIDSTQYSNDYFDSFIIELQNYLSDFSNEIGYNRIVSIDNLVFRGAFDLTCPVLSNYSSLENENSENIKLNIVKKSNNELLSFSVFPNPFNPNTTVEFEITEENFISLEIFNPLGQKITTLVSENLSPNKYKYSWSGSKFASGIYIVKLIIGEKSISRKILLQK